MIKQPWVGAGDVLADVDVTTESLAHPDEETAELLDEIPAGMNYQYFTEKMNHPEPRFEWRSKFSDYLRLAHPEHPVKTIVASPGHRTGPFHWNGRRFDPQELARLHSFPPYFEIPNATTTAREQIGNAVPPSLAEAVVDGVTSDCETVDAEELPSPRRGRTSHQTYRKRCERRLGELYGETVIPDA
jgi:DNA (cytosine-5)-methyltransferase 1